MAETRYFTGGYYRSVNGLVGGREYLNTFPCGTDVVFILFTPDYGDKMPDNPDGKFSERFDLALTSAEILVSQPLFTKALIGLPTVTADFLGFAPNALRMVSDAINMGLSMEDALSMHSARLIPEYLGETYQELLNRGLITSLEYELEGKTHTMLNINKCSQEIR